MAERPIFIPDPESPELVKELFLHLTWHPGFALSQKKKNIAALHESAARVGYAPLLEVSTKSEEKVGQRLSAFNLKVYSEQLGEMPLEMAFQGSKVFEGGGPFNDLYYAKDSRDAKRDPRHDRDKIHAALAQRRRQYMAAAPERDKSHCRDRAPQDDVDEQRRAHEGPAFGYIRT